MITAVAAMLKVGRETKITRQLYAKAMFCCLLAIAAHNSVSAQETGKDQPRHFLFIGGDNLDEHRNLVSRPDIEGVQIIYSWKSLEPHEDVYDFTAIEKDLDELDRMGKKLFVQIQDRFFSPTARRIPNYILTEPKYDGGLARQYDNAGEGKPIGSGWTTKQWNPNVRARFQALLQALGESFDGRLFGVNLPESAFDRTDDSSVETGFTCEKYFESALENMEALGAAFSETHVVQYVNFWPCEWNNNRGYMERAFALAVDKGIGLGGPDIIPFRPGQMKNSYPFFNRHKDDLTLVAMAVQEPTLTYTNSKTGKRFTRDDFVSFANDYLGVDIIFWSTSAPWLDARPRHASE